MTYLLVNRENVILDVVNEARYIKLQSEPHLVIMCPESEGTGVIGSDDDTHYPLIKTDMVSNERAVNVIHVEDADIKSQFKVDKYIWDPVEQVIKPRYTLDEYKTLKQTANKALFAAFLNMNYISWTDGKLYGCTQQDQSEIALNLTQYEIAQVAGVEEPILEWHATGEENIPWSYEELSKLNVAITEFVYPYFHQMQQYKTAIKACETYEEVDSVTISYGDENDETIKSVVEEK